LLEVVILLPLILTRIMPLPLVRSLHRSLVHVVSFVTVHDHSRMVLLLVLEPRAISLAVNLVPLFTLFLLSCGSPQTCSGTATAAALFVLVDGALVRIGIDQAVVLTTFALVSLSIVIVVIIIVGIVATTLAITTVYRVIY